MEKIVLMIYTLSFVSCVHQPQSNLERVPANEPAYYQGQEIKAENREVGPQYKSSSSRRSCPQYSLPACDGGLQLRKDKSGCQLFICHNDSELELNMLVPEIAAGCVKGQNLKLSSDFGLICTTPDQTANLAVCVDGQTAIVSKNFGHQCIIPNLQ